MASIRLALSQFGAALGDVSANCGRICASIDAAAAAGADLVCFPELALSGYLLSAAEYGDRLFDAVNRAGDEIAGRCRAAGVTAVYGAPGRDAAGGLRNSVVVRPPAGSPVVYDKTHMVRAERRVFTPGSGLVVLGELGIGLACCYDLAFPEVLRTLALRGARAVVVPMAWEVERAFVMRSVRVARAVENVMFVTAVNQAGAVGPFHFAGDSCVIDPLGQVRAAAAADVAELVVCDLDLDWVDRLRHGQDVRSYPLLADRRPALYGDLNDEGCPGGDDPVVKSDINIRPGAATARIPVMTVDQQEERHVG